MEIRENIFNKNPGKFTRGCFSPVRGQNYPDAQRVGGNLRPLQPSSRRACAVPLAPRRSPRGNGRGNVYLGHGNGRGNVYLGHGNGRGNVIKTW